MRTDGDAITVLSKSNVIHVSGVDGVAERPAPPPSMNFSDVLQSDGAPTSGISYSQTGLILHI